jgi:hypothetical protein
MDRSWISSNYGHSPIDGHPCWRRNEYISENINVNVHLLKHEHRNIYIIIYMFIICNIIYTIIDMKNRYVQIYNAIFKLNLHIYI